MDEFAPDRVIVGFPHTPAIPRAVRDRLHSSLGATLLRSSDPISADIVHVARGSVRAMVERYRRSALVRYAEPDYLARGTARTNDPDLSKQQSLVKIQAVSADASGTSAWDVTTGSPAVNVAVLDTGIQTNHPDLAGKVTLNANATTSSTAQDVDGHGTAVAGLAGASTNNATGVGGVGYMTSLMNIKVLGDDGSGFYSWIGDGIRYATDQGAKVISLSLSGSAPSQFLEDSVNYAWTGGAVVAAAAGNHGTSDPHYPAYYPNVIAIASTNLNDQKSSFSAFGSWVDVAAPGGDGVYTTDMTGASGYGSADYGYFSGTSASTPHVAGLAALVWASGQCLTNTCVRDAIEQTADTVPGTGTYWTHGRINAAAALRLPPAPPAITSSPPSTGTVGQAYSYQATATGGAPITWSLVSHPPGMTVNAGTGLVSWTPSLAGNNSVTLRATNAGGQTEQTWVVAVTDPPRVIDVAVATGSSDAEERVSNGAVTLNSDLELGYDGSRAQRVGMRFRANVPRGARVTNASIQFKVDEVSNGTASLLVQGQAADNAATFTTATSNISSRARTSASVSWSPANWPTAGTAGAGQRTPNIGPILEEIFARASWAQNNYLVLMVTGSGRRTAMHYEAGGAPVLHIEYTTTPPVGPPAVTITSPANGSSHGVGTSIPFSGTAIDPATGDVSSTLVWTSSQEGQIGSGASFSTVLSAGAHTITASATDADGTGTASINITVQDLAPQVTISAPANGSSFPSGATIQFTGAAQDEDGNLSSSLAWTSSINGPIGGDASFSTSLSNGAHTITASATDSGGRIGSASISITVGNTPKTLDVAIATASNDAEEQVSNGSMSLGSSDVELGADGSNAQRVGLRFMAALPKGAQITNAYVQFRVDEVSTGTTSLVVRGQAADNAAAFTTASGNIGARALTSASVAWNPASWPTTGVAGSDQRTPSLASMIQEIVNRPGWASGNALVLVITGSGRRTADAFEDGFASVLHVDYSA